MMTPSFTLLPTVYPTGIRALDEQLPGGGLPAGELTELYGPESSGKSAVALKLLKTAQAQGALVAWVATDSFPSAQSLAWVGVDPQLIAMARQTWTLPGLELAARLVTEGIGVVAVDSVASLLGPDPDSSLAGVLNQGLPSLARAVALTRSHVVLVNQERAVMGRGSLAMPAGLCPAMARLVTTRIRLESGEGLYRAGELLGHRIRFVIERDHAPRAGWGKRGSFRLFWAGGRFRSHGERERKGEN